MSATAMDEEFVSASRKAMLGATGSEPLRSLGWWELLRDLDDPEARAALFAVFRAQGLERGNTCGLGAITAAPFLQDGRDEGTVAAAIVYHSVRRGPVPLVLGDPSVDQFLVDRPDTGPVLVPSADVTIRAIDLPGGLAIGELDVDAARGSPVLDEERARRARARSRFLGRLAVTYEILGAAEAAVALAVEHARGREQFGTPIASFQAVRHLLAWALTDCAAVEAVADAALRLDTGSPARLDEVVKALAGRNGRRACERTLQVLGAIGFTAEFDHHHHHSRVLALDSVLGTSAELTVALGASLRAGRTDPGIAGAMLADS